ncbi:ATP-binding protein [Thermogladius sp. 4427co]|uniref:ATP-binding protein n=1 Tax=Thermogladius sp. 4427co TaxID=3450718 RepID=UPI003F7AC694
MSSFKPYRIFSLILIEIVLITIISNLPILFRLAPGGTRGLNGLLAGVLSPVIFGVFAFGFFVLTAAVYRSVIIGFLNMSWFMFAAGLFKPPSLPLFTSDLILYLVPTFLVGGFIIYSKLFSKKEILAFLKPSFKTLRQIPWRHRSSLFFLASSIYFYTLSGLVFFAYLFSITFFPDLDIGIFESLPLNISLSLLILYILALLEADETISAGLWLAVCSTAGVFSTPVLLSEGLFVLSTELGFKLSGIGEILSTKGVNLGFALGVARGGWKIDVLKIPGLGSGEEEWYWSKLFKPLTCDLRKLVNSHIIVVGASGTGKTTFVKSLVRELISSGEYNVLIFDPHNEYSDLSVDKTVRVVDPRRIGLNILSLGSRSPVEKARIIADIIASFFSLGHLQRRALEGLIIEAYRRKGIIEEDKRTWILKPPSLGDLIEICLEESSKNPIYMSLMPYLESLKEAVLPGGGIVEDIDLLENSTVIDMSSISSDYMRLIYMDTVLQLALSEMYKRGLRKKLAIVIEEAGVFVKSRVIETALSRLYMESRKFGFSIVSIAQNPTLLPEAVIVNSGVRIVFGLGEPRSVAYASKLVAAGGPPSKTRFIEKTLTNLKPGYYLVSFLGNENIFLSVMSYRSICRGV